MPHTTKPFLMLHLGLGSFHRAHQALYLHQLQQSGDTRWALAGGNIRPDMAETIDALIAQNGAYTLETVTPQGERTYTRITSIQTVVRHDPMLSGLIRLGADPHTRILSFTVTEAGYYLDAANRLDLANFTDLRADLDAARAGQPGATIYGALAPEVRRTESERFNSGQADILVATDAIGMGLNLPIRRVIFSHIHKFDGVASRMLNMTEVRQIAGRAGRFGIYETGYVNVLENDELIHIEHMLSVDDTADLRKLPININMLQIETIAARLHTRKIAEILQHHQERVHFEHTLFELAPLNTQISQALLVDEYAPNMSLRDKYIFVCAPISLNVAFERDYYLLCLQSVAESKLRHLPPRPIWLDSASPKHLEQAELLSHNLSLYAWLSFKFPQFFVDGNQVMTLRQQVSRYIERALLTQAGYGNTSREIDYLMTTGR